MNCFFCDAAEKKMVPLFYEDETFYAFHDQSPVSKGHAIVTTREHIVSFFDLPSELVGKLHAFIKDVKKIIDDEHHPDGYNIGVNDGEAAGRSIGHVHVHLIPRYKGDVEHPKGGIRNLLGKYVPPKELPEEYQ